MADIKYPFGDAETATLTATGAQEISVVDLFTIVDGVTTQATGNRTINLTIDGSVKKGATLVSFSKTAGTETTTFGTGMVGVTITGVAGKTFSTSFTYDGTSFKQTGASVQID